MSKILQKVEEKQEAIVSAARSAFLSTGYAGTSMDNIASQAAVTKQTVYRYFPSKEDLFAAVMRDIQARDKKPYQFSDHDLLVELCRFGQWLLEFHLSEEALGIYRLMLTEGANNKTLFSTFENTGPRHFLQPLMAFLKPYYADEAELAFAANMFCTMTLSVRNRVLLGQTDTFSTAQIRDHVQAVVRFFLPMLQATQ